MRHVNTRIIKYIIVINQLFNFHPELGQILMSQEKIEHSINEYQ